MSSTVMPVTFLNDIMSGNKQASCLVKRKNRCTGGHQDWSHSTTLVQEYCSPTGATKRIPTVLMIRLTDKNGAPPPVLLLVPLEADTTLVPEMRLSYPRLQRIHTRKNPIPCGAVHHILGI